MQDRGSEVNWLSFDTNALTGTVLPISDAVNVDCASLNNGKLAAIFGGRFVYVTDGTVDGTVAIAPGTFVDYDFYASGVGASERALIYNTGVGSVNLVDFPACPSGACAAGLRCVGGLCVKPFSSLNCKGDPPRPGSICSLGGWVLPGGWFIAANTTVRVDLQQPTVVEGDLRLKRANITTSSGISISLGSLNNSITVQGCVDFSNANLTIADAALGSNVQNGTVTVEIISFESFCNGRAVRSLASVCAGF